MTNQRTITSLHLVLTSLPLYRPGSSVSVSVEIPKSLYERVRRIAEQYGEDVNELLVNLLRECVTKVEEELSSEGVSEEEKKEIIERLKKLGYL
jgi:hypothetical protein